MKTISSIIGLLGCFVMGACASSAPPISRSMCKVLAPTFTGVAGSFSPSHPLGIGYPDINTPLPDHVAYLTFDDGPSDYSNDFLDILKSKGVHATFFVTSKQLKGSKGLDGSYVDEYGNTHIYRELVKRELDEGHVVGNHTVDHYDMGTLSNDQIEFELDENELLINTGLLKTGGTPHVLSLFRPPFGSPWFGLSSNATVQTDLATLESVAGPIIANHGVNVMWTLDSSDSKDWVIGESFSRTELPKASSISSTPSYADKIVRIKNTVLSSDDVMSGKGVIVLMHDTHDTTRDALSDIIDGLVANGYSFQTIEQYVQMRWGRPSIEMTPGPNLYSDTVSESDWGCQEYSAQEVCGRMWYAYQSACGSTALLLPMENQTQLSNGIMSQRFQKGTLEFHPENPIPDNIEVK